jgi:hypothetical protein
MGQALHDPANHTTFVLPSMSIFICSMCNPCSSVAEYVKVAVLQSMYVHLTCSTQHDATCMRTYAPLPPLQLSSNQITAVQQVSKQPPCSVSHRLSCSYACSSSACLIVQARAQLLQGWFVLIHTCRKHLDAIACAFSVRLFV